MNLRFAWALWAFIVFAFAPRAGAQVIFQEDFDQLSSGVDIRTDGTGFDYVRIGSGGGSITAVEFGSGTAMRIEGPSGTSLNGVGVRDWGNPSSLLGFSLDFMLPNLDGQLVMGAGSGSSFSQNHLFNAGQGLFWLQLNGGSLQLRSSSGWQTLASVKANEAYSLQVYANGSLSDQVYWGGSIAATHLDVYLNGRKLGESLRVTSDVDADAFRIYAVNGADAVMDRFVIRGDLTAIPEPASAALLTGIGGIVVAFIKRRRSGSGRV
jgi:hypothetical protein